MDKGPSPLVPLLLVVMLGLVLRGAALPFNLNLPLVSEAENAVFLCFIFIPFLVFLAIYSTNHMIILPIALVLVMYTLTTTLLGPLMLILIVYIGGVWLPPIGCNGEELGWGCLLVLVFVLLQWVLSEEGRGSWALVTGVLIFVCYHFSS